jgi:hypothetical protein
MSAPPLDHPVSISTTGYEDGFGRRTLIFDREGGGMLERLHLRPELAAFEAPLRERMARLAAFEDERFARVRTIERDPDGGLVVVSGFVAGTRICDLLDAAAGAPGEVTTPGVDAALGFLLEILPALSALHTTTGFAHGAVAPGRLTLTPDGEVVVLDSLFGQALERLQFNRRRLWTKFQIAMSPAAGPARFDFAADVSQASLAAMMIVVGRMLREDEVPRGLTSLLAEVVDIAQIRVSTRFASGLQEILERTLPLATGRPYASADGAAAEVRQLAGEIGIARCRAALTSFVADLSRDQQDTNGEDVVAPERVAVVAPEPVIARKPYPPVVVVPDPLPAPAPLPEPAALIEPEPPFVSVTEPLPAQTDAASEPDALLEMLSVLQAESSAQPLSEAAADETEAAFRPDDAPTAETIPEPIVALEPEPEPLASVEPETAPEPAAAEPDEPEPMAAAPEAAPTPPIAPPAASRRKPKRGGKRGRDKLRSAATPPPPVVVPPPVTGPPFLTPIVAPHGRFSDPLRQDVAPGSVQPSAARTTVNPVGAPTTGLKLKTEPPAGYTPAAARFDRDISGLPYVQRGTPESPSSTFPWKLAAAALAIMVVGVGAGRVYLSERKTEAPEPVAAAGAPPAAPAPALPATGTGSVEIVTQPAGTRVLLDGKPAGETPLTIDAIAPGRHTLTFVTASGSLKKTFRIEAGKKISLDVPVYSGWVAVFAPITLDISENGRGIGTTEQGRLMLAPGRHQLTLSNRELGYSSVQTVDIEPGEERAVTVQPVGELNANALPWAEVWIDGHKAGETPIAHMEVPLGTHEIVFKHPQFGDRRMTARVTATAPVAVSVDFTK